MFEHNIQLNRDKVSNLINWGHWFAFFNGLLAIIIGSRYISTLGEPDTWLGWSYLILYTVGQFSFLAFIIYLIFLFPVTLLAPYSRVLRGFAATIATIGQCILLYDTVIFSDYGLHLSPFAFELAWTDINSLLSGGKLLLAPVLFLAFQLTLANYLWKRIVTLQKCNFGHKVLIIIGICFVSSHLSHIWADATNVTDITRYDDAYPLSYPATAKTFMERHGIERQDSTKLNSHNDGSLTYPLTFPQCKSDIKPNILFISVNSFRKDMVNSDTMPFLYQYSQESLHFTHHFSGGTSFNSGMFSMLYAIQGSYSSAIELSYTSPVITQQLKKSGYDLELFSDQTNIDYSSPKAMFNDFKLNLTPKPQNSAMTDVAVVKSFKNWRKKQIKPWLALVTLNATATYDTPVGFLGIKTIKAPIEYQPEQRVLFNQYRQAAHFTDQQLKVLISNIDKDTIVIVTGAKGAAFDINSNNTKSSLTPENVNVPLIIHGLQLGARKVNYRTSHYGIAPTLMSLILGCTNPSTDYSSGQSLMSPDSQDWIYVSDQKAFAIYQNDEVTVIDNHGKYRIYNPDLTQRLKKKLSAPELIEVIREGRRLYQ
ncbi:DUF3413 domain-containing protein [Parashewanella spongiae]|uniref:DUF3413 domain-containing protein n=1 Tax=Parashewanella spongiae TaxID=342950 RepID=A0A3A6UAN0_9GAMM|nr:DUF3413 domain-containing protein [Parashewanella spongiae]MCL1078577.1 DUF3413 domain-containing protein [Parashewanella spongiae]RJY19033.1 DUF3413 domain-containing protein [Parashewanella spongiae]